MYKAVNLLPSLTKVPNRFWHSYNCGLRTCELFLAVLSECEESSVALHRMLHLILIVGNFINGVSTWVNQYK